MRGPVCCGRQHAEGDKGETHLHSVGPGYRSHLTYLPSIQQSATVLAGLMSTWHKPKSSERREP